MKIRRARFNLYLVLMSLLLVGCKTAEERKQSKEASTLRLFLESGSGGFRTSGVPVYRANPTMVTIDREPFLTEADLDSAELVDARGGFSIRAQFNGHGALILEGVTVAHRGRRIAVQSSFGESRWLAAPVINHRISNGELVFTPDATREESERIVRGLTNVITKIKKKSSSL